MMRAFRRKVAGHKRGFTLIELLVTIVILGILSVSIWAITNSAILTFSREKNLIAADDVKDIVLAYVKQTVQYSDAIKLTNQPLDSLQASENIQDKHVLFSADNGRVYMLASNVDGNIVVPDGTDIPQGAQLMLQENVYSSQYGVIVRFEPIYNAASKQYVTLRVSISVYDPSSKVVGSDGMVSYDIAARGSETFRLLNVENQKKTIEFDETANTQYRYCYYV